MNKDFETLKNSSAGDLVCGALMVIGAFVFPMTRNNKPEADTVVADFINWLPLEAFISNPALLALGCLIAAVPTYGVKQLTEKFSDESKGTLAGTLTGVLFAAWLWYGYASA